MQMRTMVLEVFGGSLPRRVAFTSAASLFVGLPAKLLGRPDLIRSPKRVFAHLWTRESEL